MPTPIHPLKATRRLQEDYARYLQTSYFFRDPALREQFQKALARPEFLVRGPILEASPPFRAGRSIRELAAAGILHPDFEPLCSPTLPWDRPLYLHQDQAIEKVVARKRNVVVATGTGSGKTETFLIPIFDHLLRERAAGVLGPGVRALLLYPMNALANDQLKRLRSLLSHCPDITFGRYTGETRQTYKDAEDHFYEQFPGEPLLPNELICRDRMQVDPPHILITNYAMLEYLLLRPKDTAFFDGDTGRFWRFIALDEAHIYTGASGIEMAMLLRRLKDRVVESEPSRLQCIATSATIGRGRADFPDVARFASQLFGESFDWQDDNPETQDIVEGQRVNMAELSATWGRAPLSLYAGLARLVEQGEPPTALAECCASAGVPSHVIAEAKQAAGKDADEPAANRFLYTLLRGDERLHELRDLLREPRLLTTLSAEMQLPTDASDSLVRLVDLAVRARLSSDSISLLPARYHVFARALEGAFVCLNDTHPAHADQKQPRLFLGRHETCPDCKAAVFELATCPRCGTAYLVGREETRDEAGHRTRVLRQAKAVLDGEMPHLVYLPLDTDAPTDDEDEEVLADDDDDEVRQGEVTLCLGCGAMERGGSPRCGCPPTTATVTLQIIETGQDYLRRCVKCGARATSGVTYRILTGQDAPVGVLATSLYQLLPEDRGERAARLPGGGRKLLTFADSRQDAAFFASYLENTYQDILHRRLVHRALHQDEAGRQGELRLQDVASRLVKGAEAAGLFVMEQSRDERSTLALTWLMQELISLAPRQTLEGVGLLRFRLVPPPNWQPPAPLLAPPWSLSHDEAWTLMVILLDSLRRQGAVTFPDNVDPKDDAFLPRNVELFVAEYSDKTTRAVGWRPKRRSNRRLDYLKRLLMRGSEKSEAPLSEADAERHAADVLAGLWRHLTHPGSEWRTHLAPERHGPSIVYRLNHQLWEWVPVDAEQPIYRCSACYRLSYQHLNGVCPENGCEGTLTRVPDEELESLDNHYRHLYLNLDPIPLAAEEHTAQWQPDEGGKVQQRFIHGDVNVLSCSTTFELGVDVGELQAVLMRNVPPTTANYVQRAGRAGRRTDSVALVVTFAQRRSHDLTHFNNPTAIVAGRVTPPILHISNEKIVRRHLHSTALAAFFRWAADHHGRSFDNVGDFFAPAPGELDGPHLLENYLRARPTPLRDALARVTPPDLHAELGVHDWNWVNWLAASAAPSPSAEEGVLDKAAGEVRAELDTYRQFMQEAKQKDRFKDAERFRKVAVTLRNTPLLGFLGSHNVLPEYGFPADVVEMRTQHALIPEANKVRLSRDLRVAIAEYAPGSQVVAAKHVWTSGGLFPMPDRRWREFNYAICPKCNRFYRAVAPTPYPARCECGASLLQPLKARRGTYVKPEFGFIAERDPKPARGGRPVRGYSSRIFFSEYAGAEPPFETAPDMARHGIELTYRYSRLGQLVVVNSGPQGNGFTICSLCGWAEPAPVVAAGRRRRTRPGHKNPRSGQPCSGPTVVYHLGHEFITDVLELRLTGTAAGYRDSDDYMELWLSLLYALLEGASESLGIARSDLDGTLSGFGEDGAPGIFLFDSVPGGAGHVRRVAQALPRVFDAAWERVAKCECGEETSCYECLRSYSNQWCHDQLKRGRARDFLARYRG